MKIYVGVLNNVIHSLVVILSGRRRPGLLVWNPVLMSVTYFMSSWRNMEQDTPMKTLILVCGFSHEFFCSHFDPSQSNI